MSMGITTFRGRLTGKGSNKGFLFFGEGCFASATGAVSEPREQKFFVHGGTQIRIKGLPEFMDFVKAFSPSANAMNFDAVIFLDLPIGQMIGGSEHDLGAGLRVGAEAAGAKDFL